MCRWSLQSNAALNKLKPLDTFRRDAQTRAARRSAEARLFNVNIPTSKRDTDTEQHTHVYRHSIKFKNQMFWLPDNHNTSAVPWSIDLMVWYCASLQVSLNIWRKGGGEKIK